MHNIFLSVVGLLVIPAAVPLLFANGCISTVKLHHQLPETMKLTPMITNPETGQY
ncbi:MAG: hypothetical protein NT040_14625 [Bacteroidetes bacterium]|nr:hypothetical protein [Bacteroidota bacterium]